MGTIPTAAESRRKGKPYSHPIRSCYTLREPSDKLLRFLHIRHFHCSYCWQKGTLMHGPDGLRWELDHMEPRSEGGSDREWNIDLSCCTCNALKFNRRYEHVVLFHELFPLSQSAFMKMFRLAGIPWESLNQYSRRSFFASFKKFRNGQIPKQHWPSESTLKRRRIAYYRSHRGATAA